MAQTARQESLSETRDRLARKLLPKVDRIVRGMARRIPSHVNRDDLHAAARLGLAEALSRPDPSDDPAFEAYALRRARGAVLDELRGLDLLTRTERAHLKDIRKQAERLSKELGREPSRDELSTATGLPAGTCDRLMVAGLRRELTSANDVEVVADEDVAERSTSPESLLSERRLLASLSLRRASLAPRLQEIVALYYDEDLSLRQIGMRFGVSEGRVSQLRKRAIEQLCQVA
jgi:RNA polymerase sigma factor FliA